jgi:hypothetical protein
MRASERLREAIRSRVFPRNPQGAARGVARPVLESGGDSVLALVFFGSRKSQASPDPWSAYDFFVLTRNYKEFYRSLKAAGSFRRSQRVAAALNAILPPNQVSVRAGGGEEPALAKCAVISLTTLLRETSERRRDHFCAGRLFQPTEVLYARDEETAERVLDALVGAHVLTLSWVRPWLPAVFDVETYCRALLRVSLAHEIRPEPGGRSDALWEAQRRYLTDVYSILLSDLATAGELEPRSRETYALARPVTLGETVRIEAYFGHSLVRATERWFKYMVTFDDWLEYIVRKARRHTGQQIVLTPREKRLPIVFLWPRVIRYLREKDGK